MTTVTPPDGFRHHTPIQVRWGDMDALGHVNNATYLTYLEQARLQYFGEFLHLNAALSRPGFIMARITLDYKLPLVATDDVHVFTRIVRFGNRSFDTEQWIMRRAGEDMEIAAQAIVTVVVYDYQAQRSTLMPDDWKQVISTYEPHPISGA